MNQQEYWENQANRIIIEDGKTYYDHPFRKRMILRYLLDYDFEKKKLLEVGCGIASTGLALLNIYGCDLLKYESIDLVEKFCEFNRRRFGLSCKQGDISNIPSPPKTFDCIFLLDVLEHISAVERDRAYQELNRVLKNDGLIFINNPISISHHDPEFDHEFSLGDVNKLASSLNGKVSRLETYGYLDYLYQFIVIERHLKV